MSRKNKKYIAQTPVKNEKKKKIVINIVCSILIIVFFVVILYYANYDRPVYQSSDTSGIEYEVGKVIKVLNDNKVVDEKTDHIWRGSMDLQIEILSGRYQGQIAETTNYFSSLYNVRVLEGDKVSIRIDTIGKNEYEVSIYNYYRVPQMIGSVIIFILLLILIGGKKGARSVLGLLFTLICFIWILLPLALKGYSALIVTILLILICNFVCFILIDGVQMKTIIATIGSICGVLVGAIFSIGSQLAMSVTTYQMDEAETLLLITSTTRLQLKDLFLCGILIACMGAVMDVAMSITSAVAEVHQVNPNLGKKELFRSGMNIGKDAMGTMSNTLILAFVGNSFNMMLMIYSYGIGFQQLMNTDFIAVEMIRSIAGSIGIICTVPIVALIAAFSYGRKKKT